MHLGCWKDGSKDSGFGVRDFHTLLINSYYGLSLVHCLPACKSLGFRYAALDVRKTVNGLNSDSHQTAGLTDFQIRLVPIR